MIENIKLSSEFKSQTTKAVMSIVLFVIVYFSIIVFAIGLTIVCAYGGIMLIVTHPRLITIVLGIGLGSLGFMVLVFLLKFIFKSHKVDRSHLYEITRNEEPKLFKMIDDIVEQVDTTFPKKVYLSSDVNASVFYDSSFWSMFFPIRKNLQIGLGLVNAVSEEELKSILAHEFGHFSQKSMKVGSYVYNVNQVIFNLLHDNEGYDNLMSDWANLTGYFAIFVVVASKIIDGIQWILIKMYEIINKNYMALSREMEFHADEIAANVTGHEPLKNSLLRLQLADHSYNSVISFYETKISENSKSENLFQEHSFVMNYLAANNEIEIENDLPLVTVDELNKFNKSKLVIEDQWASHPSTTERIKRLESLNLMAPKLNHQSANSIFKDIEKTQKEITAKLFSSVQYKDEPNNLSFINFQEDFQKEEATKSFSKIYNGYYDDKNPIQFNPNEIKLDTENLLFDDLYAKEKIDLIYTAVSFGSDLETLKQISEKIIPIKTFDYDGKKYKRKDSDHLIISVSKELEKINQEIRQNDINIFKFFRHLELKKEANLLGDNYQVFFEFEASLDKKFELYSRLSNGLQFLNYVTPFEEIIANFKMIEPTEMELKKEIDEILNDPQYEPIITHEIKTNFELFLSKKLVYFKNEIYYEGDLEILNNALNNFAVVSSNRFLMLKKDLLSYQEELLK